MCIEKNKLYDYLERIKKEGSVKFIEKRKDKKCLREKYREQVLVNLAIGLKNERKELATLINDVFWGYFEGAILTSLYISINKKWSARKVEREVILKRGKKSKANQYKDNLTKLRSLLIDLKGRTKGFEEIFQSSLNSTQSNILNLIKNPECLLNEQFYPQLFWEIQNIEKNYQILRETKKSLERELKEVKRWLHGKFKNALNKDEIKAILKEEISLIEEEKKKINDKIKETKKSRLQVKRFWKQLFGKNRKKRKYLEKLFTSNYPVKVSEKEYNIIIRRILKELRYRKLLSEAEIDFILYADTTTKFPRPAKQRFIIVMEILKGIKNGVGRFQINDLRSNLFRLYGPSNKSLDLGFDVTVSLGTYRKHDLFAVDINTKAGTEFKNVYQEKIIFPKRLFQCPPFKDLSAFFPIYLSPLDSGKNGTYEIMKDRSGKHRIKVSEKKYRDSSPADAFFEKMGLGLGFSSYEMGTNIQDDEFNINDPNIKENAKKKVQSKQLYAFLTGLIYDKLFGGIYLPKDLTDDRNRIKLLLLEKLPDEIEINDIKIKKENFINYKLVDSSEGWYGKRDLLPSEIAEVRNKVRKLIKSLLVNDNSLRIEIWTILKRMYETNRIISTDLRGAGFTIDYYYQNTSKRDDIILVEVFVTHLSDIHVKPDTLINKGDVLGKVGSTGSAPSPHNHLEIRAYQVLKIDGKEHFGLLGGLMPHEWYEDTNAKANGDLKELD